MGERLMRAEEVAEALGVTTAWVYAQSRAGRLPHVRLGRYYRYRRESIERWLAEVEHGTIPSSRANHEDRRP